MREIKKIVIHCSDSRWGNSEIINEWHLERGWDGIGYHFVITNGKFRSRGGYKEAHDGLLQTGRPLNKVGAHVRGHNFDSIGVCLIGTHWFSSKQLYETLPNLLISLMAEHDIPTSQIYGHSELDKHKTCPNIQMTALRYHIEHLKTSV